MLTLLGKRALESTLARRFKNLAMGVVIGPAIRKDQISKQKKLVARFYVKIKGDDVELERIPEVVRVRGALKESSYPALELDTDVVQTISALGISELEKIHRSLTQRFKSRNIVSIGFGVSRKKSRRDFSRGLCVRFEVKKKRDLKGLRKDLAIPTEVLVRLKRGNRFQTLALRTDVVESGRIVRTGTAVSAPPRLAKATSGAIAVWNEQSSSGIRLIWGILTVAHLFHNVGGDSVTVNIDRKKRNAEDIAGVMILRSSSRGAIDVALVRVNSPQSLVRAGIISAQLANNPSPSPIAIFTQDELLDVQRETTGYSFPAGPSLVEFAFEAYIPVHGQIDELESVVQVKGRTNDFREGRSGSAWTLIGNPVGMQIAANLDRYDVGYGQTFFRSKRWIESQLSMRVTYVPQSFRIAAIF